MSETELLDHITLYRSILDSVPAQIAVLDRDAIIIYVNRSWQCFALENGTAPGELTLGAGIGVNYLAACQNTSEFSGEGAATAREGIRQVLNGRLPFFKFEYPCHSPTQARWFSMSVTPLGPDESGVLIAHTDITDRKCAEEKVRGSLHALQVHQIELEMQNDELRRAQMELDIARTRYFNLYDVAPVGYCSVSKQGLILETNFTAAALLGVDRRELVGRRMSRFIAAAHQDIYYRLTHRLVLSGEMQSCELEMVNNDGQQFCAQLTAIIESEIDNVPTLRIAVSDVTDIRRAEAELRKSQEQLREFAAAAQSIRERGKSRIARELHDELGQALTALKMDVVWLRQKHSADHTVYDEKLEQILSLINSTVAATRRIASDLRPLILDDLGLKPAVEWLVAGFTSRSGVECELEMSPPDIELPEPYATAVFRILQEALTNIVRYALASRVEVSLKMNDGHVWLTVRDNGRGFHITESRKPNSFGLMGLRERVYLLHGAINIETAPGQGTRIGVRIPISPASELT